MHAPTIFAATLALFAGAAFAKDKTTTTIVVSSATQTAAATQTVAQPATVYVTVEERAIPTAFAA
jgi:hypothetical protein